MPDNKPPEGPGSVPQLPQQNSNADPPRWPWDGLARALGAKPSTDQRPYWLDRVVREREEKADRRRDISDVLDQHAREAEAKAVSEPPPPQTADTAVRAYILLFALGFVLRGIDVMDHDMFDAIQKWVIAAVISGVDYFYVPVRTALGPRFASTATKVGTDFRWWIVSVLVLLLWAAAAPVFEKHGWPSFSQNGQPAVVYDQPTAEDLAKATAPLQAQLDTAKQTIADLKKTFPAGSTPETYVTSAQVMTQIDALRRENAALKEAQKNVLSIGAAPASPTPTGPITWAQDNQFLVTTGGGPTSQINSVLLQGTSNAVVGIKEAYVVSGLTGHRQALMANVQYKGYFPVDQIDIPPSAAVWLELIFKPPLSIREFADQWGKFHVTIIYNDGTKYEREYDEAYVNLKLKQIFPDAFAPHVTPHEDK